MASATPAGIKEPEVSLINPRHSLCTYVISLTSAKERRLSISQSLQSLGMSFEFLDATDDRLPLSQESLSFIGGASQLDRYQGVLMQGALGCLISHLRCYQLLLDSDYQHMLVIEDDACLAADFVRIIEAALDKSKLWSMLHLGFGYENLRPWLGKRTFPLSLRLRQKITLNRPSDRAGAKDIIDCYDYYIGPPVVAIYRTDAYLITREAAQAILHRHSKFALPIDMILNEIEIPKRWAIMPRIASQDYKGNFYIRGIGSFTAASEIQSPSKIKGEKNDETEQTQAEAPESNMHYAYDKDVPSKIGKALISILNIIFPKGSRGRRLLSNFYARMLVTIAMIK